MLEYDALRMKAIVNDGTWTLSPFAIKYGIDPKAGIYYEYSVTEEAMVWFPLQWRLSTPEFTFLPSFVMKYNTNPEYRATVDEMPKDIVLNSFHEDVALP